MSGQVYDLSRPPKEHRLENVAGSLWLVPVYEAEALTEAEARILREVERVTALPGGVVCRRDLRGEDL